MKYLLDTHVWIWWNMNPEKLSQKAKKAISGSDKYTEMLLSAISPWEFCKLLQKERLAINCNPEEWLRDAMDMPMFRLVPLAPSIAYRSTILPGKFHDDPADQIIAATAIEENAVIITKDKRIQKYSHVECLW